MGRSRQEGKGRNSIILPSEDVKFEIWDVIVAGQVDGRFEGHGLQAGADRVRFVQRLPEDLPRHDRPFRDRNSNETKFKFTFRMSNHSFLGNELRYQRERGRKRWSPPPLSPRLLFPQCTKQKLTSGLGYFYRLRTPRPGSHPPGFYRHSFWFSNSTGSDRSTPFSDNKNAKPPTGSFLRICLLKSTLYKTGYVFFYPIVDVFGGSDSHEKNCKQMRLCYLSDFQHPSPQFFVFFFDTLE